MLRIMARIMIVVLFSASTWPKFGMWAEEHPQRGCAGGGTRRNQLFEVGMALSGQTAPLQRVAAPILVRSLRLKS